MVVAIGEIGLAISIADHTVSVVLFIKQWVETSKQYGDHVRVMRKHIAIETARLQSFSTFLKQKMPNGTTRFEMLPQLHQAAIIGMIQELEIVFLSYSDIVKKYNVEDLQRGYELESGASLEKLSGGEALTKEEKVKSKYTQKKATIFEKAIWGLFRQKKIDALISALEGWNNKLMNFLLCGMYFLDQPEVWAVTGKDTV
jgi:hypothetical protein